MSTISERNKYGYNYNIVDEPVKELGFGVRHFQAFLMFFCLLVAYSIRASMSIAIVAMTNQTSENDFIKFYQWDKRIQNLILSAFFLGYLIPQFPAGILATKFGGKRLLIFALGVNGLLCMIIPWAVSLGEWKALLALRIMQGLAQGCIFPSLNTLLGKWAPLNERSRITNLVYAGGPLGTVFTMPVAGYLSASSFGWPSIFYLFGTIATITTILWFYYGSDSPSHCKRISEEERLYIENSLGVFVERNDSKSTKIRKMKIPWRSIFTSVPLMATCVAHVGINYGFLTLLLETPTYLKEVHGIDMRKSGWLTSLPYMAMWIFGMSCSVVADLLVNRNIMSLSNVRKTANTIGNISPAVCLLILCMVPPNETILAVTIIVMAVGLNGAITVGVKINHLDLSPNFAGIIFGLTNTVSNILGLIAPNVVGYFVTDSGDPSEWNIVFYIVAAVYFFTNQIFIMFGSAVKQPWDDPIYIEEDEKEMADCTEKDNSSRLFSKDTA